jgi:divalent metal cation (Fe/Co/Zn/Cd) transporter
MTEAAVPLERRQGLHRRALWLEYFTVGWNVIEAVVAIGAGIIAGSVALIGFGVDSGVEVISAVGLLWRLHKAGPDATVAEESAAERRALYVVAATFFLLAAYILVEAGSALVQGERPVTSPVGLVLSVLSLLVMPVLAYGKQRIGGELGSRALVADSMETWVCSYLSLALLAGVGLYSLFGWWWGDAVGALAMLPVILWQGWETLGEAREHEDHDDAEHSDQHA